jgi:hypothetical protein
VFNFIAQPKLCALFPTPNFLGCKIAADGVINENVKN